MARRSNVNAVRCQTLFLLIRIRINTYHIQARNTHAVSHLTLSDWLVFVLARCQVPIGIFDLLIVCASNYFSNMLYYKISIMLPHAVISVVSPSSCDALFAKTDIHF
jgi:hypothetical protein